MWHQSGSDVALGDTAGLVAALRERARRHGRSLRQEADSLVSAQFATYIPAFAKPTFERFRRTRHSAQYFDPEAAPIMKADASWAIEKATAALSGVKVLLADSPPGQFVTGPADQA